MTASPLPSTAVTEYSLDDNGDVTGTVVINDKAYQITGLRLRRYAVVRIERNGETRILDEGESTNSIHQWEFWNPLNNGITWGKSSNFAISIKVDRGTLTEPRWEEIKLLSPTDWDLV